MTPLRASTLGLIATAAIGCNGPNLVKECEARSPTIAAGFSGCVDSVDDSGDDQRPRALSGFGVDVWTAAPSSDLNDGTKSTYSARTDETGFYELTVPPGHYWICSSFRRCIEQDLAMSQVKELDYEFSEGPGWSERE